MVSRELIEQILQNTQSPARRIGDALSDLDVDELDQFDEFNLRDSALETDEDDDLEVVVGGPRSRNNRERIRRMLDRMDAKMDGDGETEEEDEDVIVMGDNAVDRRRRAAIHRNLDRMTMAHRRESALEMVDITHFLRLFNDHMGDGGVDTEYDAMCDHERQRHISMLPTRTLKATDLQGKSCRICLQPFATGETVKTLLCFHQFHVQCADPWFQTKLNCPTCRHTIIATGND